MSLTKVTNSMISGAPINVLDYGASPSASAAANTTAINAAMAYAYTVGKPVYLPAGNYNIGATINMVAPMYGDSQWTSVLFPTFVGTAVDVYGYNAGVSHLNNYAKDFGVNYSNVTANASCIALRLMYTSSVTNDQLTGVKFENIRLTNPGYGIRWDGETGKGNLYMVEFNQIYIDSPVYTGVYLSAPSATLDVVLRGINVDCKNPATTATSKGYYLYQITNLLVDSCLASSVVSSSGGEVATFASCHGLTITNFQLEDTKMNGVGIYGASPIQFLTCEDVRFDISNQTPAVNSGGSSYAVYFDNNARNVVALGMRIAGPTLTSGTLGYIGANNTSDLTYFSLIDQTISRASCGFALPNSTKIGPVAIKSGTWVPILTTDGVVGNLTVAYTHQIGNYTKVGNVVTATFSITTSTFTHTTSTGLLLISGLPYAALTVGYLNGTGSLVFQGITKAGYSSIVPISAPSGTSLYFQASGSALAAAYVSLASDMPTGGTVILQGTITYLADSYY